MHFVAANHGHGIELLTLCARKIKGPAITSLERAAGGEEVVRAGAAASGEDGRESLEKWEEKGGGGAG